MLCQAQTTTQRSASAQGNADCAAIIVAGGTGERFGDPHGKQFAELCGLPMLAWSLLAFDRAPSVASLVVVCAPNRRDAVRDEVLSAITLTKPLALANAGELRQDSVRSGLATADAGLSLVAVHDAARPLIEIDAIEGSLAQLRANPHYAGVICATRVNDTLKLAQGTTIESTPDRSRYWSAQTPQCFRRDALLSAFVQADVDGFIGTDEASVAEHAGLEVGLYETGSTNLKVTLPEDLAIAEAIIDARLISSGCDGAGDVLS